MQGGSDVYHDDEMCMLTVMCDDNDDDVDDDV